MTTQAINSHGCCLYCLHHASAACFFFLWGNGKVRPHLKKRMAAERRKNRGILKLDVSVFANLRDSDVNHSRQSQFLYRESGCPVYDNTSVEYLSPGEKFLPRMLEELQSAEKYIFL